MGCRIRLRLYPLNLTRIMPAGVGSGDAKTIIRAISYEGKRVWLFYTKTAFRRLPLLASASSTYFQIRLRSLLAAVAVYY
jgi:hypothetical protein